MMDNDNAGAPMPVQRGASIVQDVAQTVARAWFALPPIEKALLKVTMRVSIALAVARFLAVQSHNTLVTLGQEVMRDDGVQSALRAALAGVFGN